MIKILTSIFESIKETNPVLTMIFAAGTFMVGLFSFINEMWGHLMAKFLEIVLPEAVELEVLSGYAFLNHCFPVQEVFAFLAAWAVFALACATIRVVKSFIPTISG